jgi:hypothetical protein
MPRVPTYDAPQVRQQALDGGFLRTPDVSSDNMQVARGLGQMGEALDRIAQRDAQDEAFKIESQIRSDWQQQRAKLREQYKGEQAGQYQAAADEWWKTARETYSTAASPRAKVLAGRALGQYAVQAEADTLGYVEGEKKRSREINFRTLQDTLIREAEQSVTPVNAQVVSEATSTRIRKDAIAYAAAEGLSSEVGESIARQQLDKFHGSVALSLAARPGGLDSAKSYLEANGKDMPLTVRTQLEDQIAVRAERAKKDQVGDLYGNLRLNTLQGAFPGPAQIEQLRQLSPEAAANLQSVINAERKARKAEALGETVKTDFGSWYQAYNDLLAGNPVDLMSYRDRVSVGDLKALATLQSKPEKVFEARMDQEDFNRTADELGLRPFSAKTEERKRELGDLKYRVEQLINTAQQNKKAPLTRDEKNTLMRTEMARTVTVNPGWFSPTRQVPVLTLRPDDVEDVVVPPADKTRITDKMRSRYQSTQDPRFAPTEENLRFWYLQEKSPAARLIPNAK